MGFSERHQQNTSKWRRCFALLLLARDVLVLRLTITKKTNNAYTKPASNTVWIIFINY